jgi:aspartyl-tRNA(Asn)/glutamyl-tRNA(Gln) amidotransferase subunit A
MDPDFDFRRTSLSDLASAVRRGDVTALELTNHALGRIGALNGAINAFVALDAEGARREASRIDALVAVGQDPGPLAGIPIGVKDLEHAAGFRTTFGSACHADDEPQTADSIEVARLRAAGCVVVGKTNTPEHGWKSDTENPLFGATRNPWRLDRSAGGSSGGSGAALASGMVPLATGSDGGGSIRIPSALNGLSGLKCSLGRVAIGGPEAPGWADLSVRGPMARTIESVAAALDVVAGPHPTDLRSLPGRLSFSEAVRRADVPLRVGFSPDLGYAPVDAEVARITRHAVDIIASSGVDVVEVPAVFDVDPIRYFLRIALVGNLRALLPYRADGGWSRLDPGLREGLEWAEKNVRTLDYVDAVDQSHQLNLQAARAFENLDLLITPATAATTPVQGENGFINGRSDPNWVRFTYPFNLTRQPAGVVTIGKSSPGLPLSIQGVGPQHGDLRVISALAALEQILGFDEIAEAVA